jgi:hypothetical protein
MFILERLNRKKLFELSRYRKQRKKTFFSRFVMHETDPLKVVVGIAASFSKSKKERGSTARIAAQNFLFITA